MYTAEEKGLHTIRLWLTALATATIICTIPINGYSDPLPGSNLASCKELSLLSLNVAHGRGEAINQFFLDDTEIYRNLDTIAATLVNERADLVALQEADRPSRWSGNFDHVQYLATQAAYPESIHSIQAQSFLFEYGTALLSQESFDEILHHTFVPSPPTFNKGFTLGRFRWQCGSGYDTDRESLDIDVVSVHLDYSRTAIRESQVDEMLSIIGRRNNLLILMGDLNGDWFDDENLVSRLSDELNLKPYRPEARDLATYPKTGRRLDWILVSPQFNFVEYRVLPDLLSDHSAVLATVALDDTYIP